MALIKQLSREEKIAQMQDLRLSASRSAPNIFRNELNKKSELVAPETRYKSAVEGTRLQPDLTNIANLQARSIQQGGAMVPQYNKGVGFDSRTSATEYANYLTEQKKNQALENARQKSLNLQLDTLKSVSQKYGLDPRSLTIKDGNINFVDNLSLVRGVKQGVKGYNDLSGLSTDPTLSELQKQRVGFRYGSASGATTEDVARLAEINNKALDYLKGSSEYQTALAQSDSFISGAQSDNSKINQNSKVIEIGVGGGTQTTSAPKDISGIGNIPSTLEKYGLPSRGFSIGEDGRAIYDPNKEDSVDLDPFSRATKRLNEDFEEFKKDLNNEYTSAEDRIKENYTFLTGAMAGELTPQGKYELGKLKDKRDEELEDKKRTFDRGLEDYIIEEKKRQDDLMTKKKQKSFSDLQDEFLVSQFANYINNGDDYLTALDKTQKLKNNIGKDPDRGIGLQEFVSAGKFDFRSALSTSYANGSFVKARDVMSDAGFTQTQIDDQERSARTLLFGQDPEKVDLEIKAGKTTSIKNAIVNGEGDKEGNMFLDLFYDVKAEDPSGIKSRLLLNDVLSSQDTNPREKFFAGMLLKDIEIDDFNKTKPSLATDIYGNPIAVDLRTGTYTKINPMVSEDVALGTGNIVNNKNRVIATQLAEGLISSDDARDQVGKEDFDTIIAPLAAQITESRMNEGRVLSLKQEQEENQKVIATPQYKLVLQNNKVIDALKRFEDQYDKVGIELTGQNIDSQYNDLVVELKNLYQLGALAGKDYDILTKAIPAPSLNASGFWNGEQLRLGLGQALYFGTAGIIGSPRDAGIRNGIKVLKSKLAEAVIDDYESLSTLYGRSGDLSALKDARNAKKRALTKLKMMIPELNINDKEEPLGIISPEERDMIKQSEGFRTDAYQDAGGYAIGYGFTSVNGKKVELGDTITQEEADNILDEQIKNHSTWRNKVKVDLNGQQKAALTSFEYNHGSNIWNVDGKQIIDLINENKFKEAADYVKRFKNFKNPTTGEYEESKGLMNRRNKEASMLTNLNA